MKKRLLALSLVLLLAAAMLSGCGSKSDKFPSGQINLIIQASPGGLSDTTARTIASYVEQTLGVPIVCTNKPGASGAVAMSYVQASAADGYTIGYIPCEIAMIQSLGYTADITPESFDFICGGNLASATITVRADSGWDTIEDLVAWCKDHPGELRVGTSGPNSVWQIASEKFAEAAGIEFNHVPFDGAAPAVAALLGKHIDMVPVSEMESAASLNSGELKLLAVTSAERSKYFPDAPTLQEVGYDVVVSAWGSFACPKGVPEDVMKVLEDAFVAAVESEAFDKFTSDKYYYALKMGRDDVTAFAQSEYEFYTDYFASKK